MALSILRDIFLPSSGMTIGELLNIDEVRQAKAYGCSVQLVGTYHELKREGIIDKFKSFFLGKPNLLMYYIIFKLKVTSESGHQHTVILRLDPDFDLTKMMSNRIQVFCTCPDFMYRSAWSLNRKKALFTNDRVKLELGEALSTAPKAKAKLSIICKHTFAAINWLLNNYTYLMRGI